jgi:hypothetical protein
MFKSAGKVVTILMIFILSVGTATLVWAASSRQAAIPSDQSKFVLENTTTSEIILHMNSQAPLSALLPPGTRYELFMGAGDYAYSGHNLGLDVPFAPGTFKVAVDEVATLSCGNSATCRVNVAPKGASVASTGSDLIPAGKSKLIFENKSTRDLTLDLMGHTPTSLFAGPDEQREIFLDPNPYQYNAYNPSGTFDLPPGEFDLGPGDILTLTCADDGQCLIDLQAGIIAPTPTPEPKLATSTGGQEEIPPGQSKLVFENLSKYELAVDIIGSSPILMVVPPGGQYGVFLEPGPYQYNGHNPNGQFAVQPGDFDIGPGGTITLTCSDKPQCQVNTEATANGPFTFEILSFADGEAIPGQFAFCVPDEAEHTTLGENRNPHLRWSGLPPGTKSLAIVAHDADAPTSTANVNQEGVDIPRFQARRDFYHWVLVDIPPTVSEIPGGAVSDDVTVGGKAVGESEYGRQGRNDYTSWFSDDEAMAGTYGGYDGPCPPWNDERIHRYRFTLYALDLERLELSNNFNGNQALQAMTEHILAKAEWNGTYTLNPDLK